MMVMLLSRALADSIVDDVDDDDEQQLERMNNNNHTGPPTLFTAPLDWQRPDLPQAQRRLAEISEMIHTASLFRKCLSCLLL
jgi:geranylgeranyl pyrophosphate synthase